MLDRAGVPLDVPELDRAVTARRRHVTPVGLKRAASTQERCPVSVQVLARMPAPDPAVPSPPALAIRPRPHSPPHCGCGRRDRPASAHSTRALTLVCRPPLRAAAHRTLSPRAPHPQPAITAGGDQRCHRARTRSRHSAPRAAGRGSRAGARAPHRAIALRSALLRSTAAVATQQPSGLNASPMIHALRIQGEQRPGTSASTSQMRITRLLRAIPGGREAPYRRRWYRRQRCSRHARNCAAEPSAARGTTGRPGPRTP